MNRWPHQTRALEQTTAAIANGTRRMCVTANTGMGKTTMMVDMLEWAASMNFGAAMYTNRRMLLDQTFRVLEGHGVSVGVRAAGYKPATLRPVQLAMTQTEFSRVIRNETRSVHKAKLVIVDELHNQGGGQLQQLLEKHYTDEAVMVGYTATPLDIDSLVDLLIVAGVTSEGRECGALVAATTYGPDEPDLSAIRKYRVGEDLTEAENKKVMMRPGVFSRVFENFKTLNPDWKPTILFAPDVAGSIYFAEQFNANGVRAAHIDGEKIWLDGELHESNPDMRDELARLSKSGEVPVVCNRFVLREGIDWPWLQHGVLACVFGSLTSYLQSCGRLLRSAPDKQGCVVQDHGGNWWRHGSINSDREWSLGMTNAKEVGTRMEKMREKSEPEPIHCPKCHAIRLSGSLCKQCGYTSNAKSRVVIQVDGSLREYRGDILKPRRVSMQTDTEKLWTAVYFRMKKTGKTFRQAEALFYRENGYYPPKTLSRMPRDEGDWYRKVEDVSFDRLITKSASVQPAEQSQ